MYKVFCDETLIYDSTLSDYVITKGIVTKEINKSGSFTFTIYSAHPYYDKIAKLKSIITVYKRDVLIFRGRVINEVIGFYKDKTFTCEGELSFLLDSIQRPFNFTGTPEEFLRLLITNHNAQVDDYKKFVVGTVTVTDPNDYINRSSEEYETTSDNLFDRLIEPLGGYLFIYENTSGERVIDWYKESPYMSSQPIEFGENLLDFTRTNKLDDIATAIIPLGAEIENEASGEKTRLTISEVNDGIDYVFSQEAVDLYGWIYQVETWDDVTLASNLKSRGIAYLADKIKQSITIELSAIDLSLMDKSIDSFTLGDRIQIISAPHNLDDFYLLEKQTIDLLKPDNDKITLGYSFTAFTDASVSKDNKNNTIVKTIEKIESNYVTNTTVTSEVEELRSLIEQTGTSISSEVLADYVINDELTEAIGTVYTQLNDLFEFKFSDLESVVNENDIESKRAYREITSYIRFEDGNIILGESGNELTVRIENDRIAFLEGDVEVAYFSNQKLYITDVEILASLRLGNFAYFPRSNGNLSFKKIGG